jgi:hypothetical protein
VEILFVKKLRYNQPNKVRELEKIHKIEYNFLLNKKSEMAQIILPVFYLINSS